MFFNNLKNKVKIDSSVSNLSIYINFHGSYYGLVKNIYIYLLTYKGLFI